MKFKSELGLPLAAGSIAALGWAGPDWLSFLLTLAFAKGLVVLGVVLQMRAGLVSFGQALYYCIGGYAAGLAAKHLGIQDAFVLLALGVVASLMMAALCGIMLEVHNPPDGGKRVPPFRPVRAGGPGQRAD